MDANDRRILSVTTIGHGSVHATELAIPIFIPIWMAEFGETAAVMGVIVAIGYALYGIGALPSGVATDEYGSMRLILLSLVGMGAGFLLLGFAPGVLGLAAALTVWGLAASIYHPAGLRLISTGINERGTAFGYHGIAGNAGIALGPLLAALLLLAFDWRLVAMLLGGLVLVGAAYTALVSVDELAAVSDSGLHAIEERTRPSLREFLADSRTMFTGGFVVVFPIVVLEGFYYRGVLTFLPDVLAGYAVLAPVEIGETVADPAQYVFVGILVVGMVGQYVGGRLSDIHSPERVVTAAFLLLGALSVAFVPAGTAGLVPLLVVSALLGFVLFGVQPLNQTIIAEYTGTAVRGMSYGYSFLGIFGVGALGAAFAGATLAYTTEETLFLLLGLVPVVAAIMAAGLALYGDRVTRVLSP